MADKYVLAIDCGTQSMRGIVFDQQGRLLAKVKKAYRPYYSLKPGWAEQNPEIYYQALLLILKEYRERHVEIFERVDTLVLTTMRDVVVCLDKDRQPVRDAILWMDQRRINQVKPMPFYNTVAMFFVGMLTPAKNLNCSCKAHWIQQNEPDVWRKTDKFVLLSTYLNYRLTGQLKDSYAAQAGKLPFDYKKKEWQRKPGHKQAIFQIDRSKLCDLVAPGEAIGQLEESINQQLNIKQVITVVAGGSDKGCETYGVGCLTPDTAAISLGSQASIQTTTDIYYEVPSHIPPFSSVIPGYYNPEIQVYRGFWMITWFKREFAEKETKEAEKLGIAPEEVLDRKLATIPPGADGLILQPYWGAGIKTPEAKGAIIGFGDHHTRLHVYRAIIEGIGFALLDGLRKIERKSGQKIEKIYISGGGSQSNTICQISASLFNRPVHRIQTYETSALGASMIGYVANGTFDGFSQAVEQMSHQTDVFYPQLEEVGIYHQLYHQIYKTVYSRLRGLYKRLDKILE